jgi:hypothetical protein
VRGWLEDWRLPAALILAVATAMVLAGVHLQRERSRCTNNGGTWVRINCRTVEDQNCMTIDYGNGMPITTCMPSTSTACDTVCRGARTEGGGQ